MQILISNDDGYTSKGLETLVQLASPYGQIYVVAPQFPQSAMSNAVSIGKMLRLEKLATSTESIQRYFCSGTPVDCVKMALNTLFPHRHPDLVLSGINHGSNSSSAALYSGTLGAAAEGALYGIPALALSICTHDPDADFSACLHFGKEILERFLQNPPMPQTYWNVNIPNVPLTEIQGIRACRSGKGGWIKEMEPRVDPYGKPYYWVVGQYQNWETDPETECDQNLLKDNYITIVPHQIDNTNYSELERLKKIY